jgi:hypothetical protein
LMTPNDSEMDVLLRRYAKVTASVKDRDHLDTDELNAFAEGALPAAARAHYLSHLADCNDCRRVVAELSAASGRFEQLGATTSQPAMTESWRDTIGKFFAPARVRYAAFAVILVAVAGIGFAIWRESHQRPTELVAQNKEAAGQAAPAASQPQEPRANGVAPERSSAIAKAVPQPTVPPLADQKQPETTTVSPPPPPRADDALARNEAPTSKTATGRAAEPGTTAAAPSYAPAPAVESERADARSREQQNLSLLHGPQRGESEKYKTLEDRSRGGDFAKARDEDRARNQADQPAKEETKDSGAARKRSETRNGILASRQAAGDREEEPKSDKAAPPEAADTRSVGGRTFKRQGSAWVDVKLKSSMSIKTVSRGSEDFEKLDSGLRSIAQQFGGPVVIVWKDKAYRIQ